MHKKSILLFLVSVIYMYGANAEDTRVIDQGNPVYYRLKDEPEDTNKPKSVVDMEADGFKLIASKNYEEALKKFDLAIAKYPKNPSALANRAFCYQAIGDIDKAAVDYKTAGSLSPKYKVLMDKLRGEMYLARGRARIDASDFKGAAMDLKESATSEVTKPRALSELAYIAMLHRDFAGCIDMAGQSSRLDSQFTDPVVTMGACYYYSGNLAAAITSSNKAITINPKLVGAYMNRLAAYVALKKCDAAKKDAATVVSIDPAFARHTSNILSACN